MADTVTNTEVVIPHNASTSVVDLFSAARAECATSTTKPAAVKTGMACPDCRDQGNPQVHVISDQSGLKCNNGHKFTDQDELMRRSPGRMPLAARTIKQEGYEPVTFSIPKDVKQTLEKKYGEQLGAHLGALMMAMAEGRNVLVCEADLKEMENKFGMEVKSSAGLKGSVIALYMQKKDAVDALASAGSQSDGEGGGTRLRAREFIVGLTKENHAKLTQMAQDRKKPLEEVAEEYLENALENNWL